MPKFTFTSDSLPSGLPVPIRARMWADSMKSIGSSFEMGIVASRRFRGAVAVLPLGRLQIGSALTVADGPVTVRRTEEGFARDKDNRIMILINAGEGLMRLRQLDREVALQPGEMSVVAMDVPSECYTPRSGHSHVVMVPRDMIERAGEMLERYCATRLDGDPGAQRLLGSQVKDLLSDDFALDETIEAAATEYIATLVGRVLALPGAKKARTAPQPQRPRIQDVRGQIAKSYRANKLAAGDIGKALGLSGRSVQHLLAKHGTTLTKELTAARLEAAFAALKSASAAPVSEIAFQCGFADLSTFHRAFRARYGATPNAVRAGKAETPPMPKRSRRAVRKRAGKAGQKNARREGGRERLGG